MSCTHAAERIVADLERLRGNIDIDGEMHTFDRLYRQGQRNAFTTAIRLVREALPEVEHEAQLEPDDPTDPTLPFVYARAGA